MRPFARILWTKNVALEEGELAYGGVDPTVKAREPKRSGDLFELHSTPEDAESLSEPAVDDIVVLTQHRQATHLATFVAAHVEPRSRRKMRKGTRDSRFSFQRICRLIAMHDFESAPFVEDAFGFDPQNEGGEVFAISELDAFARHGRPLWAVQKRLEQKLNPSPSIRQQIIARAKPSPHEAVTRELATQFGVAVGRTAGRHGQRRPTLRSSHRGFGRRK
ncbi:MAG: hypothetical protein AAF449_20070 [Myxococcota bacterium]